MCKTRSAKVLLVVFLFVTWWNSLTPTSAAQQHVPPIQAAGEQDEMIDINDAIELVDITLDGLEDIRSILRDLRRVATRSAYGSYSSTQRAQMNADFQEYINEIDLVVENTEYDGFKMLDGSIESIAVRQMRKSFRIEGIDMTQAGLGLDGDDLDISTLQSARQAVEFLDEVAAMGTQAWFTYIEYSIRLRHLPNRKIDRQDDDLLSIDEGIGLLRHTYNTLSMINQEISQISQLIALAAMAPGGTLQDPQGLLILDAMFQGLNEIDSFAEMNYFGIGMLSSSTGSITIRLDQHPKSGGARGKPLVIEKIDVTVAGLGLDGDNLDISTPQSARQTLEFVGEAMDLLRSALITYGGYLNYLETSE